MKRKGYTPLCAGCGFPVRRAIVPLIWPSRVNGRQAYCSVECWETVAKQEMPEPLRSILTSVTKEKTA